MQAQRFNPQALAEASYASVPKKVLEDPVVKEALRLIAQQSGRDSAGRTYVTIPMSTVVATARTPTIENSNIPVRAIVARPAPSDNIAVHQTEKVANDRGVNVQGPANSVMLTEIRDQYAELATKHAEVAAALARAQADLDEVTAQSIGNSDHIEGMNVQIAQLTSENAKLTEALAAAEAKYQATVEASRIRVEGLTAEIARMSQQLSGDCDQTLAQLIHAQETIDSYTEELNATKSECENLRRKINEHRESKHRRRAVIDRLHEQADAEKKLRIAAENKLAETEGVLNQTRLRRLHYEAEYVRECAIVDKLQKELDELRKKYAVTEAELADLPRLKNLLNDYVTAHQYACENTLREQQKLAETEAKLAATETKLNQIRVQEDQYRILYDTEKQRNAKLTAAAETFSGTLAHWQERTGAAERKYDGVVADNAELKRKIKAMDDTVYAYKVEGDRLKSTSAAHQGEVKHFVNELELAKGREAVLAKNNAELKQKLDLLIAGFKVACSSK